MVRKFLLGTLIAFLVFQAAGAFYLCEGTVHLPRKELRSPGPWAQQARNVEITAGDGIHLRGWWIQPQSWNRNAVLLLHGQGDNRLGMKRYAQFLLGEGFAVLMPDFRAHGESDGTLATYGLVEHMDVQHWMKWIDANQHPRHIYGLGESMGAAVLLQSLESQPRFTAAIAEAPFATFREVSYDRIAQNFGCDAWLSMTLLRPMVEAAFSYANLKYDTDFDEVNPLSGVKKTEIPVLLIAGGKDTLIYSTHSRELQQSNPEHVSLWEVPEASHCNVIQLHPAEFQQRVLNWFER